MLRCECGHLYLSPRPHESELAAIYPPTYYSYVQRANRSAGGVVGKLRVSYHGRQLRRAFSAFLRPGEKLRVLDVGCGDGRFLDLIRQAFGDSVETHGIDFDPDAVATIEQADYADNSFDLIYISHVIEHLASPRQFLGISRRLLRDGGAIHVETPNAACAEARLFRRRYWGGYHFPRHWHLFTPETLSRLAADCGFGVEQLRYGASPVFLNWTFHHILWDRRWLRPLSGLFPVTGIYRNTLRAAALLGTFAVLERALRCFSWGRGSNLVCLLRKQPAR
jgi:SAM-dependent methyltransferase